MSEIQDSLQGVVYSDLQRRLCSTSSLLHSEKYSRNAIRVARCLTENVANVLKNIFENSNNFNDIDHSLQNGNCLEILISYLLQFILFPYFCIFKFDKKRSVLMGIKAHAQLAKYILYLV